MNKAQQKSKKFVLPQLLSRWISLLLLLGSFALSARGEEALNNKSVIELHQLNLGDAVIMEKIKASKCDFDISLAGLKSLKEANLSDAVIQAMVATRSGGSPSSAPVDVNDPKAVHAPGVWLYEEKDSKPKMTQLMAETYDVSHVSAPFVHTSDAVLIGLRAAVQAIGPRPIFYIYSGNNGAGLQSVDPSQLPLVRLDVKDKGATQDRHIQLSRGGPYGGSSGISSKAICPVDSEAIAGTCFKITPKYDLVSGEYAFCWLVGHSMVGKMYTVGIH